MMPKSIQSCRPAAKRAAACSEIWVSTCCKVECVCFVREGTYFHDELHGPDEHLEELLQVGRLLELEAVPAILATSGNDFDIRQAFGTIRHQELRVDCTVKARGARGFLGVRHFAILLLKFSDQIIQIFSSSLSKDRLGGKVSGGHSRGFFVLFLMATDVVRRMTVKRKTSWIDIPSRDVWSFRRHDDRCGQP